jgi:hypothetical protein
VSVLSVGMPSRCALLGHAVIRLKHRAARTRKLRRVLPQARHDPVDVWNLIAAEPPNVGRASQLLFKRPPIFVGRGWRKTCDAEDGRHRQAQDYAVHWHVRSFPGFEIACSAKRNGSIAGLKMNAAREGSANSKQCEDAIFSLTPPCRSSSPPRSAARSLPQRIAKIPGRPYRRPDCPRSRRSSSPPGFSRPAPSPRAAAS